MVKTIQKVTEKPKVRRTRALRESHKAVDPGLTNRNDLKKLLYFMLLQRETEERIFELYRQGKIVGGVFTARGMEAISVGSAFALDDGDVLAPMHRDLGAHLVRGMTLRQVFCQYLGRKNGPSRGRDGSMHLADPDRRIIGMSSHLGAMIPVAAGAALAGKISGENYCVLTFIGDGGASSGDFHEGLNMAAVLKMPVVLIIENNQFAYSTPGDMQYACKDLVDRAIGYGIPGFLIDGNDVLEVYRTTRKAVLAAKERKGPTLIEAKTMRFQVQHNENHKYIPKELADAWQKKDPVESFKKYLTSKKVITTKAISELQQKIKAEIEEAVQFAEKSPFPDGAEALEGVYAE